MSVGQQLAFSGVFPVLDIFAREKARQGIATRVAFPLSIIVKFWQTNFYRKVIFRRILLYEAVFNLGFISKKI